MHIGTIVDTIFNGKLVGEDKFGNRYYESKKIRSDGRQKRWVLYKGISEPSKVPPEWHIWLHYTSDVRPDKRYEWQKDHLPNLTGTKNAYMPNGHILKGGNRSKTVNDYEPFDPLKS